MKAEKIEKLYTKCGWSPFADFEFPGRVACTIYRGNIIMKNTEIL
jgi:dihydroorotase-like cyclic amidohydrolase